MKPFAILACAAACAIAGTPHARAGTVAPPTEIGGAYSVPVTSLKEARFRGTIRQQYDFSCGSAALATLLSHQYNYPVTEDVVFREMYERGDKAKIQREGFSLLDIKRYLEAHGFQADGFEAELDALVQAKIPAIVLIRENGYSHFVVVKGLQDGRVLVGDPSGGTRAYARKSFEAIWPNRILFVVRNRLDAAQFNRQSDWKVAPRAPLEDGLNRGTMDAMLLRSRPMDF